MKNITLKLIGSIVLFCLIQIGSTNAYFKDSEKSTGNIMTAGTWVTTDNQTHSDVNSNDYHLLAPSLVKKTIVKTITEITPTPILNPTPIVTPEVTLIPVSDVTTVPPQTPFPVATPEPTLVVPPEPSLEVTPEPTLIPTTVPITPDLSLIGGISIE